MTVTTIILSKDRPAQLDLLLRSIERNGAGQFIPWVIARHSDGYNAVSDAHQEAYIMFGNENVFELDVRHALSECGEFVCFMCDDGILYRPDARNPALNFTTRGLDTDLLCVSLRLGENTVRQYPTDFKQRLPREPPWDGNGAAWEWRNAEHDFGYPGSIDAHVFRTADVQRMLAARSFPNPTALECALVDGCNELASERPLMACYPHSVYVGNPINRVSLQSGVRYGTRFPVSAEECNRRFLAGERIDLDALDFSGVDGAHTEIELHWDPLSETSRK